ncbi:elongation factor 1-beta [Candidatus Nanohalovita haloferacivicina]|uniref:elongation factor 1-beta n=1 Tax=Candidatus Nanohalovita haloferacivicina TaxID=2978046 RepID=UPI00325F95D7|nr:Translation elongation factor EF-1beta [Candidatus Nanohalobia archaeon BNXNv]
MGKISCVYKIMPEDDETDLEDIKKQVQELLDVQDIGEENVAFGLKAVKVSCITTDEEGGTDSVEEKLEQLDNVQSYELEHFDKL